MHVYDRRCQDCGTRFSIVFRSYDEFDRRTIRCPHCGSAEIEALIHQVNLSHGPEFNYHEMTGHQVETELLGDDTRKAGRLLRHISEQEPGAPPELHEVSRRLIDGESKESIARDVPVADTYVPPDKQALKREIAALDKKKPLLVYNRDKKVKGQSDGNQSCSRDDD